MCLFINQYNQLNRILEYQIELCSVSILLHIFLTFRETVG